MPLNLDPTPSVIPSFGPAWIKWLSGIWQNFRDLASTDAGKGAELVGNSFRMTDSSITVTVGSGGDYPTINDALSYLSQYKAFHDYPFITATISLLAGFTMEEQVLVWGQDFGWVTITGVDAETTIDKAALTESPSTGLNSYNDTHRPAFGAYAGGKLPRIGQMFDLAFSTIDATQKRSGVVVMGPGSSAEILDSCGIRRAGWYGMLAAFNGNIVAHGADFNTAYGRGAFANECGNISANSVDLSDAGTTAIHCSEGGKITAEDADLSGAGTYAASANNGGILHCAGADCSGAGSAGLHAEAGSTINGENCDCTSCGGVAIQAIRGSTINAKDADASGATDRGIQCTQASRVNADGVNAQKGGSPASTDVEVLYGGIVNFHGGTGGTSETVNTLTANGIIFYT